MSWMALIEVNHKFATRGPPNSATSFEASTSPIALTSNPVRPAACGPLGREHEVACSKPRSLRAVGER